MRRMLHAPHPPDRLSTFGTAVSPTVRATVSSPRPAGAGPAVRRRLVTAPHRPAPGPPPAHRPGRPQGVRRPRDRGVLPGRPRPRPGPRPPGDGDREAVRPARPGPDLDQPST